ncbi:class II aldolase/adducin N-terminal [Naematelia encephala]|uniref:Class II aldolase/adducin N-terminal n=1 Tax=Naematelia encephala TaxID=71784 RepID=A0A1Y2B2L3_9TREE|nr:class II aldolase/adducin N-terminal [Naematelia encephala]
MTSVHTLSSLAEASATAPPPATPTLTLFPTTQDHAQSKFKDIQSGPSRTLMPDFSSLEEERQYRKEHLVLVFRALHRQGLAEGVAGHCSTRDPIEPNTFWVNPQGRSFARMRVSDLVRVSDEGEIVQGDRPVDASATSIHAPIYKSMGRGPGQPGGSDAGCEAIVHVHGPHSKAFSALGRQLDRINQDVCAFDGCTVLVPFGGAVFDDLEGKRIGSFLKDDTKVALLQNHGPLSIGKLSIDEAAWWQLNYEMCCKSQLLLDAATHRPGAAMAPNVIRVGDEECASTKEEIGSSEMGWFCFGPYIEDEIWESKGDHLL